MEMSCRLNPGTVISQVIRSAPIATPWAMPGIKHAAYVREFVELVRMQIITRLAFDVDSSKYLRISDRLAATGARFITTAIVAPKRNSDETLLAGL